MVGLLSIVTGANMCIVHMSVAALKWTLLSFSSVFQIPAAYVCTISPSV